MVNITINKNDDVSLTILNEDNTFCYSLTGIFLISAIKDYIKQQEKYALSLKGTKNYIEINIPTL